MNSKFSVSQRPPSPQYKCTNIREAYFSILGLWCDRVQGQSLEHGSSLPSRGEILNSYSYFLPELQKSKTQCLGEGCRYGEFY